MQFKDLYEKRDRTIVLSVEKGIVISLTDPCVQTTIVLRQENALPPSTVKAETKLVQEFSQIMPVGWVVHISAASGALLKA